jgi:glycosyltransferase involved in cell wall biosynthesis
VLAGPAPDRAFADGLVATAGRLGLQGRVTWAGPLVEADLERVWARTDLLLHPSRSETWGMVVSEALAHGIPAVVARGTGAQEALTHRGGGGEECLPAPPGGDGVDAASTPPRPGAESDRGHPGTAVDVDAPDELREVLGRWLDDPATRAAWREAALDSREGQPAWDGTAQVVADALGTASRERWQARDR